MISQSIRIEIITINELIYLLINIFTKIHISETQFGTNQVKFNYVLTKERTQTMLNIIEQLRCTMHERVEQSLI